MSKKTEKPTSDDKTLILLTHGLGIITSFVAPLIILLISEKELIKKHSKVALNWQISLLIYYVAASVLSIILIGLIAFPVLFVLSIVFPILALVKASEKPEEIWIYPLSIPFFSLENEKSNTGRTVEADVEKKE